MDRAKLTQIFGDWFLEGRPRIERETGYRQFAQTGPADSGSRSELEVSEVDLPTYIETRSRLGHHCPSVATAGVLVRPDSRTHLLTLPAELRARIFSFLSDITDYVWCERRGGLCPAHNHPSGASCVDNGGSADALNRRNTRPVAIGYGPRPANLLSGTMYVGWDYQIWNWLTPETAPYPVAPFPAITQVCRQLRSEALQHIAQDSCIVFEGGIADLMRLIEGGLGIDSKKKFKGIEFHGKYDRAIAFEIAKNAEFFNAALDARNFTVRLTYELPNDCGAVVVPEAQLKKLSMAAQELGHVDPSSIQFYQHVYNAHNSILLSVAPDALIGRRLEEKRVRKQAANTSYLLRSHLPRSLSLGRSVSSDAQSRLEFYQRYFAARGHLSRERHHVVHDTERHCTEVEESTDRRAHGNSCGPKTGKGGSAETVKEPSNETTDAVEGDSASNSDRVEDYTMEDVEDTYEEVDGTRIYEEEDTGRVEARGRILGPNTGGITPV